MPENAKAPPHGEAFAERMLCLNEQRREHKRDRGQQLDQDVQARAGRVFERIAQGIADDRGLVSIGTLAAVLPALDELLGVIPGAAAVIEESRHQDSSDSANQQESRYRLRTNTEHTEDETDGDGHGDCENTGNDHLLERADSDDIDAAAVIRFHCTLENAGIFSELPAHFVDNIVSGFTDGANRERRE